jgi:hypothetical protein
MAKPAEKASELRLETRNSLRLMLPRSMPVKNQTMRE